jgi:SET domain-containing protein
MNFPHQGLNKKVEVRMTLNKGRGLFATEKIFKDEVIEDSEESLKDTQILTKAEIANKKDSELWKSLCYEIDDLNEVCPKDINNPLAGFLINHSCDPNVGIKNDNMVAMRDIEVDEELSYDYAMTDSGDYDNECLCGSKKCRGRRSGKDWMISELQKKYRGYFQKNIQNKIDSLNE